jgi:hypothetical protein
MANGTVLCCCCPRRRIKGPTAFCSEPRRRASERTLQA